MFTVATARIASLALAAAALAGTAQAAVPTEPQSVAVRHGDLDLATAQGVAKLNQRIKTAARMVCGGYNPLDLAAAAHARACRQETIARMSPKVALAIARARSGDRLAALPVAAPAE